MKIQQVMERIRQSLKGRRHKNARPQLLLECLEERTTPTLIINPFFGVEAEKGDGGHRLNSSPVYLILWGSSWGGSDTPQAKIVEKAVMDVLASPYLTGIQQYGSDGHAAIGTNGLPGIGPFVWDVSDPNDGKFDEGDVHGIVNNALNQGFLPGGNTNTIYVVVTPPGILSSVKGAGGFNFVGNYSTGDYPTVWLSTANIKNTKQINADRVSLIFSHELAEIMTDPDNGFEVNPGANWNGGGQGNQIGDYEGNRYAFREPSKVLVQPYWSAGFNGAPQNVWIVPDGHQQDLVLDPVWTLQFGLVWNFTGQYDLTINGNQLAGPDDNITIDTKVGSGIFVDQNGEQTQFGQGRIRHITINAFGPKETINIESLLDASSVTINLGKGHNTVNIEPVSQSLESLGGASVHVNGGLGFNTLNIYDQVDPAQGFYVLNAGKVQRFFAGAIAIYYSAIDVLNVYGAPVPVTFYVYDTTPFFGTTINCGSGGSTVNVLGTTRSLYIVTATPTDAVNFSSMQMIHGPVSIKNGPVASTTITMDDSADNSPQNAATLDTVVPAGESNSFGLVTGLAPASIQFQWQGTQGVHITTGTADDSFFVRSTQSPVSLDSAGGLDTVYIAGSRSAASADVQGIAAPVFVRNAHGLTKLFVDDSGDPKSKSMVTITSSSITNLARADITYNGNELDSLTVFGGSGGNRFFVRSTPGGGFTRRSTSVLLFAGAADDHVYVGDDSNTLDGIKGPLTVIGQAGTDTLEIHDEGSNAQHDYTLTSTLSTSTITRSTSAPITYDSTTESVALWGSNSSFGPDTYTVKAPAPVLPVSLRGGGSMNTLVGPNLPNTLWVIDGHDAGELGTVTFTRMQSLVGGGSTNKFEFFLAGAISNSIDGGSNLTNTLDYSALNTPVAVNLELSSAPRIHGGGKKGFSRINSLEGSASAFGSLTGPNALNLWQITGPDQGNVGAFHFSNIDTLLGGNGVDTFRFTPFGTLTGKIDGGGAPAGQGDWLDYSGLKTPVTVDLTTGQATGVLAGVTNIQNVRGGDGNDTLTGSTLGSILLGGASTNLIKGSGNGRNLLIGGTGASTIVAGTGGDILIAGTTTYDANELALMAILQVWQSMPTSLAQPALSNVLVWGVTVFDSDAPGAHLVPGGGADWIFDGPDDHSP